VTKPFDKWADCTIIKNFDDYTGEELAAMARHCNGIAARMKRRIQGERFTCTRIAIKRFYASRWFCKWTQAFRNRYCRKCAWMKEGLCNG